MNAPPSGYRNPHYLRLGRRGLRCIEVVPELRRKLSDWLLLVPKVQSGDEHYGRNFIHSYSHGYNFDYGTMGGSCKKGPSLLRGATLTYDHRPFRSTTGLGELWSVVEISSTL